MSMATDRPMEWAAPLQPDRIVATGILGLRPLRYTADGAPPATPVIEGLRVTAVGHAEQPFFHAETGLYGFLRLPPGQHRIEIVDPSFHFLPWVVSVTAPDRSKIRAALEKGVEPPAGPKPLLQDVALRPRPGAPVSSGVTAVWGVVRTQAGAPVPLARVSCASPGGAVSTFTTADGGFLLVLTREKPDSLAEPPVLTFPRQLTVHAPKAPLAADLAAKGITAGMPDNLDTIANFGAAASPFATRHFNLFDGQGQQAPGQDPNLPVLASQKTRWNIVLLP